MTMSMMSDLPQDLVEKILSRVPITSLGAVRSTCKGWNALSKTRILSKGEPKQQFLGFMMLDYKLCSMRFNLHGILNEDGEDLVEISKVFYCAGLLLCVTRDNSRLVVWNPYLGQSRWIQPKTTTTKETIYAFGYDNNNKNHKILRFFDDHIQSYYEIYYLKSNSWRVFMVIPSWKIECYRQGTSVNGNTYFWTRKNIVVEVEGYDFLICFDFTAERFGKFLDLPFQSVDDFENTGTLYCVEEEKLALLNQFWDTPVIEIWVTTKIEPNAVSWTPFLKVDIEPVLASLGFRFNEDDDSFFIDQEKKLAVVFSSDGSIKRYKRAYIIGENRYLKGVDLVEVEHNCSPIVCCSSYVPSLVQLAVPKKRDNKRKRKSKEKKRK